MNKCVLRCVLNVSRESMDLRERGKAFQRTGAATEKALLPNDTRVLGTHRRDLDEDLNERWGMYDWSNSCM